MSVTVFPTPTPPASTAKSPTDVIINSTQSWTAPAGVNQIELFLVGGGGGAGGAGSSNNKGGAGGGGGVLSQTIAVTPGTSYTVTIGAGGAAAGASSSTPGSIGSSSTFGSLVTSFGGSGGYSSDGFGPANARVASGGGTGIPSGSFSGGGGGAAILVPYRSGVDTLNVGFGPRLTVSQGTLGYTNNFAHGNPGVNGYGAGGGGGTAEASTVFGGLNAGNGAFSGNAGTSGTANHGGGGGGSAFIGSFFTGGAGGSGRCIIRYWS